MKVIFDTNIYVSFLLSSSGSIVKLLKLWQEGKFEVFVSKEILEELGKVLLTKKLRRRLKLTVGEVEQYLRLIGQAALAVEMGVQVELIKEDPSDNKFLSLAKAVKANFIVTGDKHLLKLKKFGKTRIISARKFGDILKINRKE